MARSRARLLAMVHVAPDLPVWADIGAGDLEFAKAMLAFGKAARVLCVDRAPGAVARAWDRARGDGRLCVVRGDGFTPLLGKRFDGAAMAGYGGRAMDRVLRIGAEMKLLPDVLLLAPSSEPDLPVDRTRSLGYDVVRWTWVPEGPRLRLVIGLQKSAGVLGETRAGAGAPAGRYPGSDEPPRPWYRLWAHGEPLTARAVSGPGSRSIPGPSGRYAPPHYVENGEER